MGHIRERNLKNGGIRYQAEISLKGHPRLTAMFDRKTDAKNWIHKTEADIRCDRQQLYTKGKKHTFKEAVERYFKEQEVSVVKRGHLLWWQKEIGNLYLQDIRSAIISEKKQKLLSEPNEKGVIRGKSTCNRFLATLSHMMGVCTKQWEWASENPVKKISREKEPRERTRFLSQIEQAQLLDAAKQSENPYLYTFIVLLLGSGCRYNELRFLRWADIDINQGKITITKSKNSDMRSIPIRGLPLELLRDLASKNLSLGYVFPSKDKNKPLELRRAFRTAIRRSGLRQFRGHDCRHHYATAMLAQGISLGEIGHLLGHRSISQTRRYAHLTESRSIDAVAKMSEQLFGEVENG